jgi:hypothetical protein
MEMKPLSSSLLRRVALATVILSITAWSPAQVSKPLQGQVLRRTYEENVARLFETIRAKQELPPLMRIMHRQSLDELVCSAASLDEPVWKNNSPGALMYRTQDPGAENADLDEIAEFRDLAQQKGQPTFTRYAVSVWPASKKDDGRPVYWVGIQVYMSAFWEFIDNNFTDDRSSRDEWRSLVTPPCRSTG